MFLRAGVCVCTMSSLRVHITDNNHTILPTAEKYVIIYDYAVLHSIVTPHTYRVSQLLILLSSLIILFYNIQLAGRSRTFPMTIRR